MALSTVKAAASTEADPQQTGRRGTAGARAGIAGLMVAMVDSFTGSVGPRFGPTTSLLRQASTPRG